MNNMIRDFINKSACTMDITLVNVKNIHTGQFYTGDNVHAQFCGRTGKLYIENTGKTDFMFVPDNLPDSYLTSIGEYDLEGSRLEMTTDNSQYYFIVSDVKWAE